MRINFLGSSGTALNQLSKPHDISINYEFDQIYITDTLNHRIMAYQSGAQNITVLFGDQGAGANRTQLNHPAASYFDPISNSLLIANYFSHTIVRYRFGVKEWELAAGDINGNSGPSPTRLSNPHRITLDPMGNMYIADWGNHRIQLFYNGQLTGLTIAGITNIGYDNATTLNSPASVILDNQLNLYVADKGNHRIQKYLRY